MGTEYRKRIKEMYGKPGRQRAKVEDVESLKKSDEADKAAQAQLTHSDSRQRRLDRRTSSRVAEACIAKYIKPIVPLASGSPLLSDFDSCLQTDGLCALAVSTGNALWLLATANGKKYSVQLTEVTS
jgi:hypothetical protein